MSLSAATLEMSPGQKDVDPAPDPVAPSGLVLRGVSSVHSLRDIPYVEDLSVQIESITEAVHRSFSISSISSSANASMSISAAQATPTMKSPNSPSFESNRASLNSANIVRATPVSNLEAVLDLRSEYQRASKFIEQNGKLCVTSIILTSIIERICSSFDQAVIDYLSSSGIASIDAQYFANSYHQLRDFYRHLCRIGPLAAILPYASRLSSLVKWDYRQMINSFLTLIRTSPGFIAASYLELEPAQAAAFLGCQDTDIVDRVKLAERRNPLGILYHGVFYNSPYRAKYFAAVCASVILETQDDTLCLAIFKRFNCRTLPNETAKQLTKFLRNYISNGLFLAAPTQSTPTTEVGEDDYVNTAVSRLISLLIKPDGVLSLQFTELMAALDRQVANELVEQVAIKYFVGFIRSLICDPHSNGLLTDMYISENTRRYILSPLVDRISCILEDSNGCELLDALIGRHLPEPKEINVFFAPGEHIVLSMSDIVTLFDALLPVNVGAAAGVHLTGDDDACDNDDENEWCFSNIRSDLEPVIKELTVSLPHLCTRLNSNSASEPGIFAEHWQVFKIEADGLINDISESAWSTEASLDIVVLSLTNDRSKCVSDMLANAIREAEDSGDFLDQMLLEAAMKKPAPQLLGEIAQKLQSNLEFLTQTVEKLESLLEKSLERLSAQQELLHGCMQRFSCQRAIVWYENEVRASPNWQRACDVIGILRGEKALQRSNSGSSTTSTVSSITRRSSRARRLSILSTHSLSSRDSFFVSKDYLLRPKLSDREVELTIQYMRTHRIQNFCPSEELIHRFTCEISSLVERIFDRDFLLNTVSYKRDLHREPSFGRESPGNTTRTHRMSMSVLPDMRSSVSGQRYANSSHQFRRSSPNLLDFFEWRSSGGGETHTPKLQSCEFQLGLDVAGEDGYSGLPDRSMIIGLLLSDLGLEFLERGSDVDIYMQQTGRMVLDGDSGIYQPILDNISVQTNPMAKLQGLHMLVEVARYQPSLRGNGDIVSRDNMVQELSGCLCREPGTLFRDLQLIAAFVPINVLDSTPEGQAFWDVAEVASSIVELAMSKSMGLAQRILKYHMETAFASSVTTSGISDVVAIWSFCARYGRAAAQRRLAQLYLDFPHTQLDVMPFSRPGVIFDGIEPSGVREAVAAHWMQHAADRGDAEAQQWCQERLY